MSADSSDLMRHRAPTYLLTEAQLDIIRAFVSAVDVVIEVEPSET